MKFFNWLKEARRNPDKNPKIGIVEYLEPYRKRDDVYIQYSEIKKLGIYPKSKFNTPLGIYSYPLKEIWTDILDDTVPFAYDRNYIVIFSCKKSNKVVECDDYTESMLKKDEKKLFDYLVDLYNYNENEITEFKNMCYTSAKSKHPFDKMWNYTRLLSNKVMITKRTKKNVPVSGKSLVVWNDILRMLGYEGFTDKKGKGFIHSNEPLQAVFLLKKPLKIIDIIPNKRYDDVMSDTLIKKDIINYDDFIKLMKEYDIDQEDYLQLIAKYLIENGFVEYNTGDIKLQFKFKQNSVKYMFILDYIDEYINNSNNPQMIWSDVIMLLLSKKSLFKSNSRNYDVLKFLCETLLKAVFIKKQSVVKLVDDNKTYLIDVMGENYYNSLKDFVDNFKK